MRKLLYYLLCTNEMRLTENYILIKIISIVYVTFYLFLKFVIEFQDTIILIGVNRLCPELNQFNAKAFYSQFYQIFALLSKLQFQAVSGLILYLFVSHNIYNKLTIRSSYIHNGNLPNIKENLAIRSN